MSGKRKVRRVLIMIDYGEGEVANGEVFDITALVSEMLPRASYGAHLEIKVEAYKTYRPASEVQQEMHISFSGYAGEFVHGATHLDDVINAAMPDGERVLDIKKKAKRLAKKVEELHHDAMAAKLRQVAEIRHQFPIARFTEPLPALPGVEQAPTP